MSPRILVVEDERDLAFLILRNLEVEGYTVRCAHDGDSAGDELSRNQYELLILDLMLPKRSGLDVLGELRRKRVQLPVIILTARSGVPDRVKGLKAGADDYLTKPFEMAELLARVEAVLRRTREDQPPPVTLDLGGLHLDFTRLIAARDGEPIAFSSREFRVLRAFAQHRGRPLSREDLLRSAWGEDEAVTPRTVDAHVKNLRKKIEPDPSHPTYIRTLHREGYILVDEPAASGD